MNQNKYSRLLQTLNQCGVNNADKLVSDFKQFMKYQKLNKDIDNMIEQAHEKKISDEEFKAMIDEQKEIMKGLGIRNIKFKEPPSPIKKPSLSNSNTLSNSNNKKPTNVKVFNITEITTYNLEGDRYTFYGPNNQVVQKVRLNSGQVKNVSELSVDQKENISESINSSNNSIIIKPVNAPNKKEVVTKKQENKPNKKEVVTKKQENKPNKKEVVTKKQENKPNKKEVVRKTKPKKSGKKTKTSKPKKKYSKPRKPIKRSRRKTQKLNKYWYHQLPEHAMKNVSVVKGKRRRLPPKKKKPEKLIKNIPEVNKKGERVPFRGFFDLFKV